MSFSSFFGEHRSVSHSAVFLCVCVCVCDYDEYMRRPPLLRWSRHVVCSSAHSALVALIFVLQNLVVLVWLAVCCKQATARMPLSTHAHLCCWLQSSTMFGFSCTNTSLVFPFSFPSLRHHGDVQRVLMACTVVDSRDTDTWSRLVSVPTKRHDI